MNERVLAIVTIIAQYILSESDFPGENDLISELLSAGFASEEIDAAFRWMEQLHPRHADAALPSYSVRSQRVFSRSEELALSLEARSFLLRLRSHELLDDILIEEIIHRACDEGIEDASLTEIKALISRVLVYHARSGSLPPLEAVLDGNWRGHLH